MHIHVRLTATMPGWYRSGFLTPPADGAAFVATLVANTLHGALPPVDLLSVMVACCGNDGGCNFALLVVC
jgi:hypothetical protein